MKESVKCADCGGVVGVGRGPADGWQLEDGRVVCHRCCVADTKRVVASVIALGTIEVG
jgi:hypothetical protein